MPKENVFQRDIVKSVIAQGGHARKQSHAFSVGIPDLMIRMPGFTAIEAEVKRMEDLQVGFSRSLRGVGPSAVTPKQLLELNRANAASPDGLVAFVFVILRWRDEKPNTLVALSPSQIYLTDAMIGQHPHCVAQVGGRYDIRQLLEDLDVPRTCYRR